MKKSSKNIVGMVHKETIEISVAGQDGEVRRFGQVNSLAANQRPNISMIDRRHRWPGRVPFRACWTHTEQMRDPLRPVDKKSHINV